MAKIDLRKENVSVAEIFPFLDNFIQQSDGFVLFSFKIQRSRVPKFVLDREKSFQIIFRPIIFLQLRCSRNNVSQTSQFLLGFPINFLGPAFFID